MTLKPENKPEPLSADIRGAVKRYGLKSSWVPPLNRWVVRSEGFKDDLFWTSRCGEEFADIFQKFCINNQLSILTKTETKKQ
jgi:hypothetical protein